MRFSIITICLNSEKTIERAIKSVLNQTFQDFEYIIVDGKSTDRTLDIIHSYEEKFAGRLKVISEKDNGLYDAMNKGIRMAKGEWIGLVNSDDFYEPDGLEKFSMCIDDLQRRADEKIEGVIYGMCRYFDDVGEVTVIDYSTAKNLAKRMMPHPSSLVSRTIYERYGLYDGMRHPVIADYDLFLKFYEMGVKFYSLEKIISNFYIGGASSTYVGSKDYVLVRYQHGLISWKEYLLRRLLLFCKDKIRRFL